MNEDTIEITKHIDLDYSDVIKLLQFNDEDELNKLSFSKHKTFGATQAYTCKGVVLENDILMYQLIHKDNYEIDYFYYCFKTEYIKTTITIKKLNAIQTLYPDLKYIYILPNGSAYGCTNIKDVNKITGTRLEMIDDYIDSKYHDISTIPINNP